MNQLEENKQKEFKELHKVIIDYCSKNNLNQSNLLTFLALLFAGTMSVAQYSDEFFDMMCSRMKIEFKKMKNKLEKFD